MTGGVLEQGTPTARSGTDVDVLVAVEATVTTVEVVGRSGNGAGSAHAEATTARTMPSASARFKGARTSWPTVRIPPRLSAQKRTTELRTTDGGLLM